MATVKYLIASVLLTAFVVNGLPNDPCSPDCTDVYGSFPNPRDCTKYYQCAQGIAIPRTCPDGTYFNPVYSICDYPENAQCTADPEYDCWGTTAGPATTPAAAGTTAAPQGTTDEAEVTDAETTEGAEETTAGAEETTAGAEETTAGAEETTAGAEETTAGAEETTAGAEKTTAGAEETTAGAEETTAGAEETTAGAEETTAGAEETTAGAEETTAGAEETTAEAEETTAAAEVTTAAPAVTTAENVPTTTPGECVPPCPSSEAKYPNPRDCGSYYQCSHGSPYLFTCYPGLYYNPQTGSCDFPGNVDCTAGPDAPCVAVTQPPTL